MCSLELPFVGPALKSQYGCMKQSFLYIHSTRYDSCKFSRGSRYIADVTNLKIWYGVVDDRSLHIYLELENYHIYHEFLWYRYRVSFYHIIFLPDSVISEANE